MFWTSAPREHRLLSSAYGELTDLLARPDGRLFGRAAHVSDWTPAQHAHHLAAINNSVFDWLEAVCDGQAEPDSDAAGGAPNLAGRVLLWLGRFPRGRGRSPKPFVPPSDVGRAALEEKVAAGRAALSDLEACTPRMKRLAARRRHPVMGMLDATEWMRFARMHTDHHLCIVRDILSEQEEVAA